MPESPDLKSLREALAFAATSVLPFPHKSTIIQVLNAAIRSTERTVAEQDSADRQHEADWSPDTVLHLQSLLEQHSARSWQHADEVLMRTASALQRPAAQVRAKAIELGLGHAVDYRIARQRDAVAEAETTTAANSTITPSHIGND